MKKYLLCWLLSLNSMLFSIDEFTPRGVYTPPFFAELLDVEVYDEHTIYTFGVGGLVFLDVENLSQPKMIGHFDPGDIYNQRFYNVQARASLAIGAARQAGLYVLNIDHLNAPQLMQIYNPSTYSYESVAFNDSLAYAAVHEKGIEVLNIKNPKNIQSVYFVPGLTNCWDVVLSGNHLFAADGGAGLKIYSLKNPLRPELIASLPSAGSAKEVLVKDQLAFVALGASGIDIVDLSSLTAPRSLAHFKHQFGIVNHLAVHNTMLFAATWELVMAIDISEPDNPRLIATEDTPTRAMGLAVFQNQVFVSDWNSLRTYTFQDFALPDIHVKPTTFDFGFKGLNQPIPQKFKVFNLGESALEITNIAIDHFDFQVEPRILTIESQKSAEILVTYTPTHQETYLSESLTLNSNDPDEPTKHVSLFAGQNRLAVGDSAPDFYLPDVNNHYHRLSDYRGQIVLLAFFASW